MNSHVDHFDPVLENMKEKKYKFKECIPFAWSPFMCTSCKKIPNFQYNKFEKNPSQNGPLCMNIHGFQVKGAR